MAVTKQNNTRDKKLSNRRRKKRRTEDFSSSSESSSSSSSSESDSEDGGEQDNKVPPAQQVTMDDIEIDTNDETSSKLSKKAPDNLTIEQKQQLNSISFSTTLVSEATNPNTTNAMKSIPNLTEVSNSIESSKQEINTRFLKLMTKEFGNDIDELRKKPDFKEASLSVLAKTLQSGANMFDIDVLQGLLGAEGKDE